MKNIAVLLVLLVVIGGGAYFFLSSEESVQDATVTTESVDTSRAEDEGMKDDLSEDMHSGIDGSDDKRDSIFPDVSNSESKPEVEAELEFQTSNPMTVVLSVPSVHDDYYTEVLDGIIDFHVGYANTIHGNDDVIVLADADTLPLLEGRVPSEILREADVFDIWMRDFTTVNPLNPVQFRYEGEYFEDVALPREIQASFIDYAQAAGVGFRTSEYILDGGNLVDNYAGSIVVSERFLEENGLTLSEGVDVLKREYGATHVAIIPYDDPIMGHADGMVMFVDDVLFVNQYEEPFRTQVMEALQAGFPESVEIVEVAAEFELEEWKDFASACGININSLVTHDHIYIPTFGNPAQDDAFVATVKAHTDKQVHTVDAQNVCFMGGSVRCLSWQIANATL